MSDKAHKLRLFFALPLAPDLHPAVTAAQERLNPAGAKVKWVEAENLHFTLKFLGATPAERVERLIEVAESVSIAHQAHQIELSGVGAFPNPQRARVVWIGCGEGAEQLTALADDLEAALVAQKLAEKEKRGFSAHLTIGRVKAPHSLDRLAPLIEAEADTAIGSMACDHFSLLKSDLTPQGPIYTTVHRFDLTG